jgi:hypothetical protein
MVFVLSFVKILRITEQLNNGTHPMFARNRWLEPFVVHHNGVKSKKIKENSIDTDIWLGEERSQFLK